METHFLNSWYDGMALTFGSVSPEAEPSSPRRQTVKFVIDASVALKWFFNDCDGEQFLDIAENILGRYAAGELQLIAPVHLTLEICAILVREALGNMQESLSVRRVKNVMQLFPLYTCRLKKHDVALHTLHL